MEGWKIGKMEGYFSLQYHLSIQSFKHSII